MPIIIENVFGAMPYMGRPSYIYGSFYLWGDVPPFMPRATRYAHDGTTIGRKGFTRINEEYKGKAYRGYPKNGLQYRGNTPPRSGGFHGEYERKQDNFHAAGERGHKARINPATNKPYSGIGNDPSSRMSSRGPARKILSAQAAMIPFELAYWIGRYYHPDGFK
jgi:hypothetical protein